MDCARAGRRDATGRTRGARHSRVVDRGVLERATARLQLVMPFTLLIIFVLLYMTFRRIADALLIMATLLMLSMFVIPAVYYLLRRPRRSARDPAPT